MGIEPTGPMISIRPNGFEDRARHQPTKHFQQVQYSTQKAKQVDGRITGLVDLIKFRVPLNGETVRLVKDYCPQETTMKIDPETFDTIAKEIHSDTSPVGIDAKKTHILILQMLQKIESRLVNIEKRLAK